MIGLAAAPSLKAGQRPGQGESKKSSKYAPKVRLLALSIGSEGQFHTSEHISRWRWFPLGVYDVSPAIEGQILGSLVRLVLRTRLEAHRILQISLTGLKDAPKAHQQSWKGRTVRVKSTPLGWPYRWLKFYLLWRCHVIKSSEAFHGRRTRNSEQRPIGLNFHHLNSHQVRVILPPKAGSRGTASTIEEKTQKVYFLVGSRLSWHEDT